MDEKRLTKYVGLGIFIVSFLTYWRCLAPTTSFWDCGEFIACSYLLGVPHPPGAPLYLLVGRLFSMIPFAHDIGYRVNLFSALASALTITLVYLTILRLIAMWRGRPQSTVDRWLVHGSAVVGALAFAFTDTFWFNSVEAEVYALSMLLTAAVVYLILVWHERAEQPGNERYLLLIAYIIGLAIGVHLLNVLAIPAILLVVYFRLNKGKETLNSFLLFSVAILLVLWAVYPGVVKGVPWIADKISFWGIPIVFIGLLVGAYQALRSGRRWTSIALMSAVLVLVGYSTYTEIYIRSNLDPPVDENDPETLDSMVYYLNREQYGTIKPWPRPADPYSLRKSRCRDEYDGSLSFLWKYQIRAMYIRYFGWQFIGKDRSVAPANPDDACRADTFTLNGLWALPFLIGLMGAIHHFRKDWRHAFVVLVLFLATGIAIVLYLNQPDPQPRERDYVYVGSFYAFALWIGLGLLGFVETAREWLQSGEFTKKVVYVLGPSVGLLLLGVILESAAGLHGGFTRALKGVGSVGGLFALLLMFVGFMEALRDRLARGEKRPTWPVVVTVLVFFVLGPVNLFAHNFHSHNRSGRYVPYDYSYNMLQTCEPNAIVFTNGDNDTFPLWFLQYVEKVRPDIRIVNLSLLNTPWYIKQLKHREPRVPISLTDRQIEALQAMPWKTRRIRVPVPAEVWLKHREEAGIKTPPTEEELKKEHYLEFDVRPTLNFGGTTGIRVQDYMILNILYANQWKRPIYFAVTVSPSNKIGLDRYLRMDGLDFKIVSISGDSIAVDRLRENLFNKFLYRNLNNPKVYYDDNTIGLLQNYRAAFLRLAYYYHRHHQLDKMVEVLDKMEEVIPESVIPLHSVQLSLQIGQWYYEAGRPEEFERRLKRVVEQNPTNGLAVGWLVNLYRNEKRYNDAIAVLQEWLKHYPTDADAQRQIQELQRLAQQSLEKSAKDTTAQDTAIKVPTR